MRSAKASLWSKAESIGLWLQGNWPQDRRQLVWEKFVQMSWKLYQRCPELSKRITAISNCIDMMKDFLAKLKSFISQFDGSWRHDRVVGPFNLQYEKPSTTQTMWNVIADNRQRRFSRSFSSKKDMPSYWNNRSQLTYRTSRGSCVGAQLLSPLKNLKYRVRYRAKIPCC